ncbi:hypothetical protein BCR34DRAFT_28570 [Clohesyomyces aquaticus]|uniref:BTB domain-containing protein n=1 Tax=Clohesyomyces aquaticus TaxID=1231657 RepID=A0A1Y1ZA49_9PLEO|nr:hypothetical protein BCR34DRAFT_28570 [Clohesyomyces aquaticus]
MAPSPSPTQSSETRFTITIVECGDVLLQSRKLQEQDTAVELLVASQILSITSPVFKAMFQRGLAEGQGLSAATLKEVPLPVGDATLVTILCNVFHMASHALPTKMDPKSLADFAVLCDKYDCKDAVELTARVWCIGIIPDLTVSVEGLATVLFTTWVLDLPKEFHQVNRTLLRDRTGTIPAKVAAHSSDSFPWKLSIVRNRITDLTPMK